MARYRHPKHGFHIVSYGDDLAAFKAAGWVLDEPQASPSPATPVAVPDPTHPSPPVPEAKPVPAPQALAPAPRREWRPKRGR